MKLTRIDANPLLTPDDLAPTRDGLEILCTLNPGAARLGRETILLVRVGEHIPLEENYVSWLYFDAESGEMKVGRYAKDDPNLETPDDRGYWYKGKMVLSSLSHLRVARSTDGVNFTFDPEPAIFPSTPYEAFGCEDARITPIDGRYYITYTAVSPLGCAVAMASTTDFRTYEKHGIIFPPYQKDVAIFPAKIRGQYVCRHRPYKSEFNDASIWTAYSPDLRAWGTHSMTLAPKEGTWEAGRVGCGAAPIKTPEGWLEIYHAADARGRYALGAMLSDLDHPEKLISRSSQPVFEPEAIYEITGIYGNCVFTNGIVVEQADPAGSDDQAANRAAIGEDKLWVYYGAADRICAAATTTIAQMIQAAMS